MHYLYLTRIMYTMANRYSYYEDMAAWPGFCRLSEDDLSHHERKKCSYNMCLLFMYNIYIILLYWLVINKHIGKKTSQIWRMEGKLHILHTFKYIQRTTLWHPQRAGSMHSINRLIKREATRRQELAWRSAVQQLMTISSWCIILGRTLASLRCI